MADVIEEEENGGPVVSERVQALAHGIYDEFQGMVEMYGPESIGSLMPLVVNVLENLDSALADNQDHLTALMEVNEENQQLTKQYQREKQKRKDIEDKAMRLEDVSDQEMRELKEHLSKVSLDNRSLSSKIVSQKEQIERLEDKNETMKKEMKELHDRNIGMIKNFHGQMETFKENAAIRIKEARRSVEEIAESPVAKRAPGFQDFMSPSKGAGKKKRQLPIAPHRRGRAASGEDEEELFFGTTPAQRPDSPEFGVGERTMSPPNLMSLRDEQRSRDDDADEDEDIGGGHEDERESEEGVYLHAPGEEFDPNEESLLAELHLATSGGNVPGVDQIIIENEQLLVEKGELSREVDELMVKLRETENDRERAESVVVTLRGEKESLTSRVGDLEGEVKKLRRELEEETEKTTGMTGEVGPEGLRLTRLEVARVLRERNEYKEKYLSLLEQIRMNDELYLFKRKEKRSRWLDYFAALFSPSKRRQMEQNAADSTPRRPILGSRRSPEGRDEDDGGYPQPGAAGYRNTMVIPTLKKLGKRQDEMYMTSVSWVIPALDQQSEEGHVSPSAQPPTPNINTCRPMSYQEEGAKVLCTAAINPASFLGDHRHAVSILKEHEEASMSVVWIVTGVPNLTKVSILDAAAVGEVLETFPVCSSPIKCIAAMPEFNDQDPDMLASLSTARRKPTPTEVQNAFSDRPSSRHATMWMGSDTGVLYVHSAVSQWKKCIHADKLQASIQCMVHLKGKAFLLLSTASLVVFRRFSDGEWDWDNYSIVVLSQRKDLPCSALTGVKFNVWCAVGNTIHVVHSHLLRMEATFQIHSHKRAEVNQMVSVGDGVWLSLKYDSTLRLFHATNFTHMQDLDIAPSIRKVLVFGSDKRSAHMPIQISTVVVAHNALWVGTENGVLLTFPFNAPTLVTEETGWEVIKEAEVVGVVVPEPFDVRTEHAVDAAALVFDNPATHGFDSSTESKSSGGSGRSVRSESPLPPSKGVQGREPKAKPFNPFCNVDQVQLSIHCHINSVKSLLCVPGLVPKDLDLAWNPGKDQAHLLKYFHTVPHKRALSQFLITMYEPLGGVFIGSGDETQRKPALFVMSCGEGHLDLRTADKVLETLQAKEAGESGLPSAASIISEKNYIMVWDIAA